MDSAFHEPRIRFDIRAEREEYERPFRHPRVFRKGGDSLVKRIAGCVWSGAIWQRDVSSTFRLHRGVAKPTLSQRTQKDGVP